MTDHIVSQYDDELSNLTARVGEMGGLVEQQVNLSVQALITGDKELASSVIEKDKDVDHLEGEIDEATVLMIAKRQPMASDLRTIVAAMRVCQDMERVGDLAKNIARRAMVIDGEVSSKSLVGGVENMAQATIRQLNKGISAYLNMNTDAAVQVIREDDEIDALYTSLFRELLTYMMEDPRKITACTHLLFCAKNLERIGDHATNIAEQVSYVVHGEITVEHKGSSAAE